MRLLALIKGNQWCRCAVKHLGHETPPMPKRNIPIPSRTRLIGQHNGSVPKPGTQRPQALRHHCIDHAGKIVYVAALGLSWLMHAMPKCRWMLSAYLRQHF